MKLDFFLMADDAVVDEHGKLNVRGGGISHVVLPIVPAQVAELMAVTRLVVEERDFGREHPVRVTLREPSGDLLTAAEGSMTVPESRPVHPDERFAMILIADFGRRTFNEFGLHRVDVEVDGVRLASGTFSVEPDPSLPLT